VTGEGFAALLLALVAFIGTGGGWDGLRWTVRSLARGFRRRNV
jgi:hypothetical protein